jgi:hypothetical protein
LVIIRLKTDPRSLIRWVEKYKKDGEIKRENRKPVALP